MEEPRRRPFEEPFEELLDRDEGTGHRSGECSRGHPRAATGARTTSDSSVPAEGTSTQSPDDGAPFLTTDSCRSFACVVVREHRSSGHDRPRVVSDGPPDRGRVCFTVRSGRVDQDLHSGRGRVRPVAGLRRPEARRRVHAPRRASAQRAAAGHAYRGGRARHCVERRDGWRDTGRKDDDDIGSIGESVDPVTRWLAARPTRSARASSTNSSRPTCSTWSHGVSHCRSAPPRGDWSKAPPRGIVGFVDHFPSWKLHDAVTALRKKLNWSKPEPLSRFTEGGLTAGVSGGVGVAPLGPFEVRWIC